MCYYPRTQKECCATRAALSIESTATGMLGGYRSLLIYAPFGLFTRRTTRGAGF
jgi:hypothetical protein